VNIPGFKHSNDRADPVGLGKVDNFVKCGEHLPAKDKVLEFKTPDERRCEAFLHGCENDEPGCRARRNMAVDTEPRTVIDYFSGAFLFKTAAAVEDQVVHWDVGRGMQCN
jgi:hypothetical protein